MSGYILGDGSSEHSLITDVEPREKARIKFEK